MKDVEIWIIKDPDGNIWTTPKGKGTWGSSGAAKNAWCYHHNPIVSMKWGRDAESIGWTCECIARYELVPK